MVMRNLFFVISFSVLGFIAWFSYSLGFFKQVEIKIESQGPLLFVFKEHIGPYHFISKTITDVERWAKTENIDCSSSFGEYLDDPKKVEHERLRSRGGCLISQLPKDHKIPTDLMSLEKPVQNYVIAEFAGSPALGPYKVYNKVEEYMTQNNIKLAGPVIEIYQMKSPDLMLTKYLFPIQ